MNIIETLEAEPAQCPLRPIARQGALVRAVPEAQRPMLAPAAWIVSEWTPYVYTCEGATHLRVGSHEVEPLVEGVFPVQFENQLGLTAITPYRDGFRMASPVYVEVIAKKFQTADDSLTFLKSILDDLFSQHPHAPSNRPFFPQPGPP